jgi:hypothetical protein
MTTLIEEAAPALAGRRCRTPAPRRPPRRSTISRMAAYATLSKSAILWGEQARGVEAVVVTDGQRLRVLGSAELAAELAAEPFPPGDPAAVLQAVCGNVSWLQADGPFRADGSLDEVVTRLQRDYQLPLVSDRT